MQRKEQADGQHFRHIDGKPGTAFRGAPACVLAATIGNTLEWYDFLIYGFLAVTIAKLFFPTENELTSLLLSVGTFGAAAVVRPIAGVVLGIYADRVGRKAALTLTIFTMGLGTGLIVVAPTYASIGIWAPVLMVTARLLQGFACGGEWAEQRQFSSRMRRISSRGLYASWQTASQAAGVLLGAMVTMLVSLSMTQAQLEAWGWRLPFAFGLLIVPVGFYIRSKLKEPDAYLKARTEAPVFSFMRMLLGERRSFVIAVGVAVLYLACAYVLFVYMPTFAVRQLQLPFSQALIATTLASAVLFVCSPIMADDLGSIRPQAVACRRRIGICDTDLSGFRADHQPSRASRNSPQSNRASRLPWPHMLGRLSRSMRNSFRRACAPPQCRWSTASPSCWSVDLLPSS